MDDIKCHSPNLKSMKIITACLEKGAEEVGLTLNRGKCGLYSRATLPAEDNDLAPFLPEVREGYKYLGLDQLKRNNLENYESIEAKIEDKLELILKSDFTTDHKFYFF